MSALTAVKTLTTGAVVMAVPKLATQAAGGGAIAAKLKHFNAPLLDVSDVVSIVAATDITIHDFSVGNPVVGGAIGSTIYALAAKNMIIDGLSATNSVSFDKAALVSQLL